MKVMRALFVVAVAMAICVTIDSYGQRPQAGKKRPGAKSQAGGVQKGTGGGQRGGSTGGNNLVQLAQNEAVQKEIELVDEQLAEVKKLADAQRTDRDQFDLPDLQNVSAEEREKKLAELRQRRQDLTTTYNQKLAEIVLPHQYKRLREISVQVRGVSALADSDVAGQLKLTEEQKQKIEQIVKENSETLRAQTQELRRGNRGAANNADREAAQKKLQELQAEGDDKLLAVLTSTQKAQFETLKGDKFEMLESARGGQAVQRGPAGQKGAKGPAGKRPAAANGQGDAEKPQPKSDPPPNTDKE